MIYLSLSMLSVFVWPVFVFFRLKKVINSCSDQHIKSGYISMKKVSFITFIFSSVSFFLIISRFGIKSIPDVFIISSFLLSALFALVLIFPQFVSYQKKKYPNNIYFKSEGFSNKTDKFISDIVSISYSILGFIFIYDFILIVGVIA